MWAQEFHNGITYPSRVWLVRFILRCTLTMSDFQGPMMDSEGFDIEPEAKHRNSIMKQRILAVFGLEMYFVHERFSDSDDAAG
ncbi:hypothetical protein EVAR_67357_1, partial [Eumeta japonica]